METDLKITLFLDKRLGGIVQPGYFYGDKPASDFFVTIPLYRSKRMMPEYVNMSIDPFKTEINRQLINPFFIELGFFETINSLSSETKSLNAINVKAEHFNIKLNS